MRKEKWKIVRRGKKQLITYFNSKTLITGAKQMIVEYIKKHGSTTKSTVQVDMPSTHCFELICYSNSLMTN